MTRGDLEEYLAGRLGCATVPVGTGLENQYPPAVAVRPASPYRLNLTACRAQTVLVELIVCPVDALDAWDQCDQLTDETLDALEACDEAGDWTAPEPPMQTVIDNRTFWTVTLTVTLP